MNREALNKTLTDLSTVTGVSVEVLGITPILVVAALIQAIEERDRARGELENFRADQRTEGP